MQRDSAEPTVTSFPGAHAKEWVNYHQEHAAPSTYVYEFVWDITEHATGPFCKDVDGNVLLDMTSHVGASPLGYNNEKVTDMFESFFDMGPIDPGKIAGQDFYLATGKSPDTSELPTPSHLMDELTDIASHYDMDTVFLSNSGAEAVENGMKICYDDTDGKYGVTFDGAFHGRTLGTLSLNRSKGVYRESFPEISSVESVPYCRNSECTQETCGCGFFTRTGESLLDRLVGSANGQMTPEEIAYIIIEPIQGEGGYHVPSDAFMDEIHRIAQKYDIRIIADEVQSGVARTGEWWGADNYSIEPDVLTVAKPARVGATIANSDVFPDEKSRLSSTWGAGDILATAQGVATIRAIKEYNLLDNATQMGHLYRDLLHDNNYGEIVDVRQNGLMIGVEFVTQQTRDAVVDAALQNGLLLLACGQKTVRVLPPLDVTEREARLSVELLFESVSDA